MLNYFLFFVFKKMIHDKVHYMRGCTEKCKPMSSSSMEMYCCNDKDDCNSFEIVKTNKLLLAFMASISLILLRYW